MPARYTPGLCIIAAALVLDMAMSLTMQKLVIVWLWNPWPPFGLLGWIAIVLAFFKRRSLQHHIASGRFVTGKIITNQNKNVVLRSGEASGVVQRRKRWRVDFSYTIDDRTYTDWCFVDHEPSLKPGDTAPVVVDAQDVRKAMLYPLSPYRVVEA